MQVCELAAAAEAASEHPLARAVLEYAETQLGRQGAPARTGADAALLSALRASTPRSGAGSGGGGVGNSSSRGHAKTGAPFVAAFSLGGDEDDDDGGGDSAVAAQPGGVVELPRLVPSGLRRVRTDSAASGDDSSWSGSPTGLHRRTHAADSPMGRSGGGGSGGGSSSSRLPLSSRPTTGWPGNGSGSGACNGDAPVGSPVSTPKRLHRILVAGMLRVSDVVNHPGKGVTARLPESQPLPTSSMPATGTGSNSSSAGGLLLALGNRLLLQEAGVVLPQHVDDQLRIREEGGHTIVLLALGQVPVAALAVCDPLKPEAAAVVAALAARGLAVHLLTGDNWRTARAVASTLGIPRAHVAAEVLPAGKAAVVRGLQDSGRVVAMVGDGVNDSPALAVADVGIALGSGTDVAVEAADYVLMRADLGGVLTSLALARATFRRIQANFAWALGYNLVAVPIAAGALYPAARLRLPPWVAGGCMVFSSLSVVLSSLALRRFTPPHLPHASTTIVGAAARRRLSA